MLMRGVTPQLNSIDLLEAPDLAVLRQLVWPESKSANAQMNEIRSLRLDTVIPLRSIELESVSYLILPFGTFRAASRHAFQTLQHTLAKKVI